MRSRNILPKKPYEHRVLSNEYFYKLENACAASLIRDYAYMRTFYPQRHSTYITRDSRSISRASSYRMSSPLMRSFAVSPFSQSSLCNNDRYHNLSRNVTVHRCHENIILRPMGNILPPRGRICDGVTVAATG